MIIHYTLLTHPIESCVASRNCTECNHRGGQEAQKQSDCCELGHRSSAGSERWRVEMEAGGEKRALRTGRSLICFILSGLLALCQINATLRHSHENTLKQSFASIPTSCGPDAHNESECIPCTAFHKGSVEAGVGIVECLRRCLELA